MKHDLHALKDTLTISVIWVRLGLPGAPRAICRSPFRPDRSPSFSLYDNGRRWKDFATGEGGDAIDFIAKACAVDNEEAMRRFLAMGGVAPMAIGVQLAASGKAGLCPPDRLKAKHQQPVAFPSLHRGTPAELEAVATSRGLSPAAVALAQSLGTLAFGEVCGFPCWILTDGSRRVAEARRIDRQPFPAIGELGARKAHTLRGSAKSWPVGAAVLRKLPSFRAIMLVEGGPDYLAALHFCLERDVHDVLPVAMLGRGSGSRIDAAALALLKGRRVRIYPHADADGGGLAGSQAWADQLLANGCSVEGFPFTGLLQTDGQPVNDLNDCAFLSPEHEPRLTHLIP